MLGHGWNFVAFKWFLFKFGGFIGIITVNRGLLKQGRFRSHLNPLMQRLRMILVGKGDIVEKDFIFNFGVKERDIGLNLGG